MSCLTISWNETAPNSQFRRVTPSWLGGSNRISLDFFFKKFRLLFWDLITSSTYSVSCSTENMIFWETTLNILWWMIKKSFYYKISDSAFPKTKVFKKIASKTMEFLKTKTKQGIQCIHVNIRKRKCKITITTSISISWHQSYYKLMGQLYVCRTYALIHTHT